MTNAEALIQGLQSVAIDDDEVAILVTSYINCPYIDNPDCEYTAGDNISCDYCKLDWLKKEFES